MWIGHCTPHVLQRRTDCKHANFFPDENPFMADCKALFVTAALIPGLCIFLSTRVSSNRSWWWMSSSSLHTYKASRGLCETTHACVDQTQLSKMHRSPGTDEASLQCVFARGVAGGLSREMLLCTPCTWRVCLLCEFWCEPSDVLTEKTLYRSLGIYTACHHCGNAGGFWVCWSVWRLRRSVHTGKAEYLNTTKHLNRTDEARHLWKM